MTREECLDWLYRLRGEIYVYIQPKEWLILMNNALDVAIKALGQEPCEDAISRQAAVDAIENTKSAKSEDGEIYVAKINAEMHIQQLPSISTEKTGHWISTDEEPHEDYECSCCGYVVSTFTANIEPHTEYKYCPSCGAKMAESEGKE